MNKDVDGWLSEFVEAAQASARSSQVAAEKDYAAKLKLFTPRFERARASDVQGELAGRLGTSAALAGQKNFDAASDTLDEAWTLAASMLASAPPTLAITSAPLPPEPADDPAHGTVDETAEASIQSVSSSAANAATSELENPIVEGSGADESVALVGQGVPAAGEMTPPVETSAAVDPEFLLDEALVSESEQPAAAAFIGTPVVTLADALAERTVPEELIESPVLLAIRPDELVGRLPTEETGTEEALADETPLEDALTDEPLPRAEAEMALAEPAALIEELPGGTDAAGLSEDLRDSFAVIEAPVKAAPAEDLLTTERLEDEAAPVADEPAAEPSDSFEASLEDEFADLDMTDEDADSLLAEEMPVEPEEAPKPVADVKRVASLDDV